MQIFCFFRFPSFLLSIERAQKSSKSFQKSEREQDMLSLAILRIIATSLPYANRAPSDPSSYEDKINCTY